MKIQYMSDLHLEGSGLDIKNKNQSDLLVLAGDIVTAKSYKNNEDFFKKCSDLFKDVVYVAGNHEFYRGDIEETRDELFQFLYQRFLNIHFLDDGFISKPEYYLWGGTLWPDCNNNDPVTKTVLQQGMNDYRLISWKSREHWKLRPDDTIELHNQSIQRLKDFLITHTDKPVIVVTHHAPSYKSTNVKYENDHYMNGGYRSDLEYFMGSHIPLWFHGHMHDSVDYTIEGTHVVSNPRGYIIRGRDGKSYTENEYFDPDKVIEFEAVPSAV